MKISSLTLLLAVAWAGAARALDNVWTSNLSTDWNTGANWTDSVTPTTHSVPDSTAERAVFNGTGTQTAVTFAAAAGGNFNGILMTAGQTSNLSIDSSGGANMRMNNGAGITIQSGAGAFSLGTSGSNFSLILNGTVASSTPVNFQNDSANTATLGSHITFSAGGGTALPLTLSGSGNWQVDAVLNTVINSFTKSGAGTTTLTAVNTYTGNTTISAGKLTISGTGRLGSGSYAGNIALDGTLEYSSSANQTLSGNLSGGGTLLQTGGNTAFILSGDNSGFTGAAQVTNNGYIRFNSSTAGSENASWDVGSGTSSLVLNVTGVTVQLGALSGSGRVLFGGGVTSGSVVIGNLNTDTTYSGVISNAIAVTKVGTGTLTLDGTTNSYTGGTTINGGTLAVGASTGTLGASTGTITVDAGNSATLDLLGTTTHNFSSGTVTIGTGSQLTINHSEFTGTSAALGTFSGALSGAGNLVIGAVGGTLNTGAASRRMTFTNAAAFDNFTGAIEVQSGTNMALFNGTLTSANSNNLTIDSGGYVTLISGSTTFVGALNGGGSFTMNTSGSGTASLSVASGNFSGVIASNLLLGSGTVTLTKTGSGTLILSGNNTYTGTTTVNNGVLEIAGSGTLGAATGTAATGTTVNSGGTLRLNNATIGNEALTLNGTGYDPGSGALGALANTGVSTYGGLITIATGTSATINNGGGTLNLTGGVSKNGSTVTFTGGGKTVISINGISGSLANSDLVVNGATLVVNAASDYNGPTDVINGGTLAGVGPITSTVVTISGNSYITAGTDELVGTIGIFDFNATTFNLNGTYLADINLTGATGYAADGTAGDLISIDGDLDLTGGLVFDLRGTNTPGPAGSHYAIKLLEFSGTGTLPDNYTVSGLDLASGQSVVRWGNAYYLVPEPTSFALLSLGCLLLLRRPTRRRRRQTA